MVLSPVKEETMSDVALKQLRDKLKEALSSFGVSNQLVYNKVEHALWMIEEYFKSK